MHVPLLDLKAQLQPLREEILAAVTEVVDSTRYIMGPRLEALEEEVAAYSGTQYGIGVSSGTDALLVSLMALGVGQGDLVITTPYTFFATMGVVLRLGARPVFVDIDPETYNIDPYLLDRTLEEHARAGKSIKAMIPVHLYGQCADMASIVSLAEQYSIPVVEDAAQAIGAVYPGVEEGGPVRWQPAGSMGDVGCFSFFPSKNLGGIGDGGMVVTSDEALARRLRQLRMHGMAPKYYHAMVGGNFRMDPIQAAVLSVKLPHLPEWHRARRRNAARYNALFHEADLVAAQKVTLPKAVYSDLAGRETHEPDFHIYNQYVLRVADRDGLKAFLDDAGVGNEIYYPLPLHQQECLAGLGYGDVSFPEAERAARETIALPVYPELTEEMQQYVVDRVRVYYS
jgi:dTDP-4-amino-4,6-dideoxygalactose transaminase